MRRAGFVVLAALLGLALADCSTKQDDTVTVSQPTPPHGHAYFDLKFRPAETARVDAPDAIWNADTLDTCYSNGICAVQGTANAPSWGWTLRCNGDPSCDQATYRIGAREPSFRRPHRVRSSDGERRPDDVVDDHDRPNGAAGDPDDQVRDAARCRQGNGLDDRPREHPSPCAASRCTRAPASTFAIRISRARRS
jgi:hypothetical protein